MEEIEDIIKGIKKPNIPPQYLVVMGVSGTGKTTIAVALAEIMGWPFQEGDELHPKENVEKMASGHPLNDTDRAPWLKKCHKWLAQQVEKGEGGILTCSSLKRSYRDILEAGLPIQFVYIHTTPEIVKERITARTGHYMPPSLLKSQFDTLEEPADDEPVIQISGDVSPHDIVNGVIQYLAKHPKPTTHKVYAQD